jgi:hypothetical protein
MFHEFPARNKFPISTNKISENLFGFGISQDMSRDSDAVLGDELTPSEAASTTPPDTQILASFR